MSDKKKPEDDSLAVFYSEHDQKCAECNRDIETHSLIFNKTVNGAICLACAGLDGLVVLPSGNTALTVRSRKYSKISAPILRYNKARKRYERQGILVEEQSLEQAKLDCESDAAKRAIQRKKSAVRRDKLDREYQERFTARIRQLFPHCPAQKEFEIAKHACEKYSGRVGRSADAKALNDQYVRLAVIAHVRHTETDYDSLLSSMFDKKSARKLIRDKVDEIISLWEYGNSQAVS
jgi:hypothetical protein